MHGTIKHYWEQFISGDRLAFKQIYTWAFPSLYEYGMRRVSDEDVVRDAIHDIFVKLWEGRAKLSDIANPKHYLLVTLKNSLLNIQIREQRLSPLKDDQDFQLQFDLEAQIINNELDKIRAEQLKQALEKLTAKQREVIYLRYFEELSYEEIQQLTHISVRNLYKLNHRAMESLKEILSWPKSEIVLTLSLLRLLFWQ